MDQNEFLKNFTNQFDETDPASIGMETKFRDLDEWSSLTALSIIAMSDEKYGVSISGEEIKNSETVADILKAIKSKLQ